MKKYKQLDLESRKKLFLRKIEGMNKRDIADKLGVHRSTIYREIKRNKDVECGYLPDTADKLAKKRKYIQQRKLWKMELMQKYVMEKLKQKWSPEMISGRAKLDNEPFSISTEAIYQFIYSTAGKKLELFKYLLRGRPNRNIFKERKKRATKIPNRISIHDRPTEINERKEIGHFEADLTFNIGNQSENLGVIHERFSRYTLLQKNPSKHTNIVMKAMFNRLAKIPKKVRKSVTFDNGSEFTQHQLLNKIDVDTFFCDPHSPWQKGQVENANAFLHRFIPKKKPLKDFTDQQILDIQNKINNMPRKCLNFKTPAEVFHQHVFNSISAFTGRVG